MALHNNDDMKVGPLNSDYTRGYLDGKKAGATAENNKLQPVIDALTQFITRHEGGLLPDRFTYEKGVKALEQWNGAGKEVEKTDEEKYQQWIKENVTVLGEFDFIVGQKRIYGKRDLRRVYEYLTNPTK